MPIPFGVSVGDFIASIEAAHELISCLKDNPGSQAQCRRVSAALNALQLALVQVEHTATDSNRHVVICIIDGCETTITRFSGKLKKYEGSLGSQTSTSGLKAQLRKIQWQRYGKEDVRALQDEVQAHVSAL